MKYVRNTGDFYPQKLKKIPFFTLQKAKCTINTDRTVTMDVGLLSHIKEQSTLYKKQVDKWFSSLGLTESELVTF